MTSTSQQPRLTVGDTVTVIRSIAASPGAVVQARAPVDSLTATMIAPAVITREGDSVRVAYTLAVWRTGQLDITLPGLIVVGMAGKVDTLPDAHASIAVASVLPDTGRPQAIPPRSARPWIPRAERSALPFVVLLPIAIAVLVMAHLSWRRRGPIAATSSRATIYPLTDDRVETWLAAGESRLVLDHVSALLDGQPDAAEWCAAAEQARFRNDTGPSIDVLARDGWQRVKALRSNAG